MNFDELRNRTIGTVEFVSSKEIKVILDTNAPQSTAINTGTPQLFPKINGYVLVPNEDGSLIGMISWIGIEYSNYPKRRGYKDFDLVDLPFPTRKLSISPIGILRKNKETYYVERGVFSYPSIGDTVAIPSNNQLKAIVENKDINAKVKIGTSPMAANEDVYINPDKLFGRHLAVLGNTGSGKSCSVAGLIRWSIQEAKKEVDKLGTKLNMRFLIIDPNDEYSNCFNDLGNIRKYKVLIDNNHKEDRLNQLKLPSWMWNSYEWAAVTRASDKSQRPLLRKALREIKYGELNSLIDDKVKIFIQYLLIKLNNTELSGISAIADFPGKQNFGEFLQATSDSLQALLSENPETLSLVIIDVKKQIDSILQLHPKNNKGYYSSFSLQDIKIIKDRIVFYESDLGKMNLYKGPNSDSPLFFENEKFVNYLEQLIRENSTVSYMDFFMMRIKTMLSDIRIASVINTKNESEITLSDWLNNYVGSDDDNGTINIFDLSLVPSEILFIVVSVFARITFEAHQRYRRKNSEVLPTTLVIEEAHNFIKRYNDSTEDISATQLCTQAFEKIAKEGRKFGLGLVLSSQRPAELSSTVLSQCNTFLLHRVVNDRDQDMVKRLVPDSLGGILNELPILPTKKAILLGWAAPIPTLVEMNDLSFEYRPKSNDPDFWDVWTGKIKRSIRWEDISKEWQRNYNDDEINKVDNKNDIVDVGKYIF